MWQGRGRGRDRVGGAAELGRGRDEVWQGLGVTGKRTGHGKDGEWQGQGVARTGCGRNGAW